MCVTGNFHPTKHFFPLSVATAKPTDAFQAVNTLTSETLRTEAINYGDKVFDYHLHSGLSQVRLSVCPCKYTDLSYTKCYRH